MPPLMQLPGYQVQNALLNYAPISEGLDTWRQGQEAVRRNDVAKASGNALMAGDYKGAMGTALAGDRADLAGLAMQAKSQASQEANHALDREHKMAIMYGGVAQQALQSKDPRVMQQAWQRMVSSHPEFAAKVQQFGVDPNDHAAGLNFVMAQAAGYRDPQDRALKQAQINNLNRREEPEIARTLKAFGIDPMSDEGRRIGLSKMGGEAPASVREWNYYNGLNPEQQAAYRQMKRSDKTVDTGTEFVNISNPNAPRIAKDVSGAASLKEQGKAQGQAAVELPAVLQRADDALATIEKLRTHPGREWGTGSTGIIPGIPGTHQKDFVELNEQAKGGAFLQAFQLLKGGGAITNIEGDKATKAIARLDRTQTREGYLSALKDLESVIVAGAERARAKARGGATVPQGPQAKIAPAVQVKSVDEAMALQPGTRFMTPDGREKIR